MESLTPLSIILIVAGAALGYSLSWLWLRGRFHGMAAPLRQEIQQLENEKSQLSFEKKSLSQRLVETSKELSLERQEVRQLTGQVSHWETEHKNLVQRLKEQKADVEELNSHFKKEFKNLANDILEEKSKKFTTQNKENLGQLLNPLRDRILEFQKKVEDTHTAGEKRNSALNTELKNLKELNQQITAEARSLTQALRGDSKTQGGWGEMQLETILEKAGLQKDIHFFKEKNFKTEEGQNQRLDFILNLPDDKHLVLDSKVSLSAYSRYYETDDDAERQRHLKDHLASMHGHLKLLGGKNYQSLHDINTPDYVLMFIANEPALTIALREDPQLYEKALHRNIVLVSTTTLLATLRTVSYIWKQDLQNKNAEEIARQAGALYDKFVGFSDDLIKLGNQMATAQKTHQDAMTKLTDGTGNLIRRSENLRELGAKTTKSPNANLMDREGGS